MRPKSPDFVLILFLTVPVFLFSLKIVVESGKEVNLVNLIMYLLTILVLGFGMYLTQIESSKKLQFTGFIFAGFGIFATMILAFVLKDVVSLALVALILIPIFLTFLLLKN